MLRGAGRRAGAWCETHREQTVALWVLGLALVATLAAVAGGRWSSEAAAPGARSGPTGAASPDVIRLAVRSLSVDDPAVRDRVEAMLGRLLSFPHVADVISPFNPEGLANVSKDRRIAYADLVLDRPGRDMPTAVAKRMIAQARAGSDQKVTFALSGQAIRNAEAVEAARSTGGAVALGVVLVAVAFGWTLAKGAPAVTALASGVAGVSVVQLLAHVVDTPNYAPVVAGIVGLSFGLDAGLAAARGQRRSIVAGAVPAAVALVGMVLVDLPFVPALALGSAAAVLAATLASATLVPAVVGRAPARPGARSRRAARWSPPRPAAPLAVVVLAALAVPILFARLGVPGGRAQPTTAMSRQAYDLLGKGFGPGYATPLVLSANGRDQAQNLEGTVRSVPGVAVAAVLPVPVASGVAAVVVTPTTGVTAAGTNRLVHRLQAVPGAHVGGLAADSVEADEAVRTRMPLLIGVTIGLLFLVRLALSHSTGVALRTAGTKLVAVLAAYGGLAAVAQWGLGQKVVFYPLPVVVLAVVLASTGDRRSLIVVPVFLALALSGEPALRQAGLGLVLAVLVDATVVWTVAWLVRTRRPPSGAAVSPPSRARGRSPVRPTSRRSRASSTTARSVPEP